MKNKDTLIFTQWKFLFFFRKCLRFRSNIVIISYIIRIKRFTRNDIIYNIVNNLNYTRVRRNIIDVWRPQIYCPK